MATHSNILAWKSPWTEEPGWLQSMGLHDWACVHEGGGSRVGSNKLVELKKYIYRQNFSYKFLRSHTIIIESIFNLELYITKLFGTLPVDNNKTLFERMKVSNISHNVMRLFSTSFLFLLFKFKVKIIQTHGLKK